MTVISGHQDRVEIGNRPNGIYMLRFRNVNDKHPTSFVAVIPRAAEAATTGA